jgi:hypothetical protein
MDSDNCRPPIPTLAKKRSVFTGMTGRYLTEQVAVNYRNGWPTFSGFGGRFAPEYATGTLQNGINMHHNI